MNNIDEKLGEIVRILEKEFDVKVIDDRRSTRTRDGKCVMLKGYTDDPLYLYYAPSKKGFSLSWTYGLDYDDYLSSTPVISALRHSFLVIASAFKFDHLFEHYIDRLDRVIPGLKRDYEIVRDFVSELKEIFTEVEAVHLYLPVSNTCILRFYASISPKHTKELFFNIDTHEVLVRALDNSSALVSIGQWDELKSKLITSLLTQLSDPLRDLVLLNLAKKSLSPDISNIIDNL